MSGLCIFYYLSLKKCFRFISSFNDTHYALKLVKHLLLNALIILG